MVDNACLPAKCRTVGLRLCENPKSGSGWVNEKKTESEQMLTSQQYQGFIMCRGFRRSWVKNFMDLRQPWDPGDF